MTRIFTILLIAPLVLTGCAQMRELTMAPEANLISGAGIIVKRQNAEKIDVDALMLEFNASAISPMERSLTAATDGTSAAVPVPLQDVYIYRRNDLQSKLIMASNDKCAYYVREITAAKAQANMGWGSLSLLLSGAASVVSHAETAKALAAGATVATGTNALYDQAYFNNLAVSVIAAGISKQREGILTQINNKRTLTLVQYPVHRAIADALQYHAACNILNGLEAAAVATKLAPAQPVVDAKGTKTIPEPQISPQI